MIGTIVKIDLVGSKSVAAANQVKNPEIRKHLLQKLLEVANSRFPASDQKYPEGSYYKAEGDALYFILAKPTVALRASIEFMQSWFNSRLPDLQPCPDCRVIIDRGDIQTVSTPAGEDFVSAAFENIAVAEKGLQGGHIYLTHDVVSSCDRTMARFVSHSEIQARPGEKIRIYWAEFLDPRTTGDSSLLHALFISNPKSEEARDIVLEIFILEYLLENSFLENHDTFNKWAGRRSYPELPRKKLEELCERSSFLLHTSRDGKSGYELTEGGTQALEESVADFKKQRQECLDTVSAKLIERCGTPKATDQYDLPKITEDFLCAIFSDIRMMANYFRETSELFEGGPDLLGRFDYLLRRNLPFNDPRYFGEWKAAFVEGLQAASKANNRYIAAVFHNVLATYYLNRSPRASSYQIEKLQGHHLCVDTNVLYALRVPASNYHEAVKYFFSRLAEISVPLRVFPFSIEEYEGSLALVEKEVKKNEVSTFLLKWNPWLYQEFKENPGRYLGQISVCRQIYSVAKGKSVCSSTYDEIDAELKRNNLALDREFERLSGSERDEFWAEIRQHMSLSRWSMGEYFDFINDSTKSAQRIAHDVDCIKNLEIKFEKLGKDELGPRVMFITLDKQLARARHKFEFIVTSEQFLEFMLPYLFLGDIPIKNAEEFPNQLLTAQLGIFLGSREIAATDLVRGFLTDPDAPAKYAAGQLGAMAIDIATALSSERLQEALEKTSQLPEDESRKIAEGIAGKIEEIEIRQRVAYFENQATQFSELKLLLAEKDKRIEKLQKTVKYFRGQSRRGKGA